MYKKRCPEILFVEDNPVDEFLIEHCFKDDNSIRIKIIKDGKSALNYLFKRSEYCNEITPDLIVLDDNLNDKSGRQIMSEFKANETLNTIPVIIFLNMKDQDNTCKNFNADKYFIKPMFLDEYMEDMNIIKTMVLSAELQS